MLFPLPSSQQSWAAILLVAATGLIWAATAPLVAMAQRRPGPPVRDGEHRIERHVWNWRELKQQNVVMQRRDYSCGAAALATLIRYYWGDPVGETYFLTAILSTLSPEELRDRVANGLTMTDLRRAAVRRGYLATIGRLSYQQLTESKVPLVVGITVRDYDHFVVYRGTDGYYVYLADPIRGNIRVPAWEFVEQWQRNAVLVVAKPGASVRETSPLTVTSDETFLGETNREFLRRDPLKPPRIRRIGPLLP